MEKKRCTLLWEVEMKNKNGDKLPLGDLLIIAPIADAAARKARQFTLEMEMRGYRVTSVKYSGSIDVF